MMATAGPPSSSSFLPLLESLEDGAAALPEQTDAYLTIANRLSGEEGRHFLPAVEKHFPRLGKAILVHISSPNVELGQAALQALGFCVYHSQVVSGVPETFTADILTALCSVVMKSTDKNTCTRALWVISKQSFPPDVVGKKVPSILGTLESVWSRDDIQSVVMEHEALNVIIRLLEQVPAQMGDGAVRWAKLVVPLVVHSASKVRLRAAAAMEMGMPLLLEKQTAVAAIIEPMMSTKLIPELQKLFTSKNETNVLKLWPLFVKLLGKMLHRGGPFINSLLHLEELGFRSSSPTIKKIAFIAWKSLIDNFSLNPDILCSAKRLKLLMQPLMSINVRTEALLLTKVEVWWYLVVQLGPNLSTNFDQVSVPLLNCTIGSDPPSVPGTPSRAATPNGAAPPGTPKTGGAQGFNTSANSSRLSLNSSLQLPSAFPSIQLLGLEMLLHYFLGPEAVAAAAKRKLILSLEPLKQPLLSSSSSFTKHAAVLVSSARDGFINGGRDAPDSLLSVIWTSLVRYVNMTIESVGSKKERQGSEVLTLMLQALQTIVASEALPADRVLLLLEATVTGIPHRVLGSTSYQVGKMDVLNGTPALFLILLLYNSSLLPAFIQDERFFQCLQTLVGCGLSGPTSPLAFAESVLGALRGSAASVQNKEQLLRMWSVMVAPLTDTITQSNEVNQGDALEHNFSAVHSALLFPVTHLLPGAPLQQAAQKSMLSTWSKLYKVFARCSALVVTAEENICCEELCAKMTSSVDKDALKVPSTLNAVSSLLQMVVECVDFSPYTPQFQQKLKSPHTPVNWMKKKNRTLGNLSTFQSLLVQCLDVYLDDPEASSEATGVALVSVLSALFTNLVLANAVREALASLVRPLALFYQQAASEPPRFTSQLQAKLEKLLGDVLGCLQSRSTLAYDSDLLSLLSPLLCEAFPHRNKQLRTAVTHFWNATFANSVGLSYPEEIRPILSQVKQKIPIILPGFEAVTVSDELSGQYSSESSQMETKLSGMPVSSVGKRDSLLGKVPELKDKSSAKSSKPVSTKLDFGSPKPPRREALEEEASIDFVFIPPETKQRVLTEHQKEVKRTKRIDIPAMYNNLDASLDTTVFSQYTQSQEDSLDKLPAAQADKVNGEAPGEVPEENEEDLEILSKATQDYASPKEAGGMTENHQKEEMIPESTDVSMEDDAKNQSKTEDVIPVSADVSMEDDAKIGQTAGDKDAQAKEGSSPDVSSSSDLILGTPQKPNSRRQSFITLEKYTEGKSASPSSASKFTGPLTKTSNSQESSNSSKTSSPASQTSSGPNSQASQVPSDPVSNMAESPRRPKDSGVRSEPVRLTERLPSDTTEDEDVIPGTQIEMQRKESSQPSEEMNTLSQEEDLDDSQSSLSQTSSAEPRRSGRSRVRPMLPGETPEDRDDRYTPSKRKRSGEGPKSDSQKSSPEQSKPNTRSKQAAEEDGSKDRLRTRAQKEKGESSQTNSQGRAQEKGESSQTNSQGRAHKKVKLYSGSGEFLDKPESRRRSTRDSSQSDLLSDSQSDYESQSQGRRGRRSKASLEAEVKAGPKKKVSPGKEQSSQTTSQELEEQTKKNELKKDSQVTTPSPQAAADRSQEFEVEEQTEKNDGKPKTDSQVASPPIGSHSEEFDLVEKTKDEKKDSSMVSTEPDGTDMLPTSESEVKDEQKTKEGTDGNLSQEDSQVNTPSPSGSQSLQRSRTNLSQEDSQVSTPDSQSLRRSGRSKAVESEDKSDSKDSSSRRQSRSNSQTVGQAEVRTGGRTRRSKLHEELSKTSPSSTPESSQSLDEAGSTENSQGRGRYSRRRSSQVLASAESSGSESPETRENLPMPKKRGRKPKALRPSPLTIVSKGDRISNNVVSDIANDSQNAADFDESQGSQDLESSELPQVMGDNEEQSNKESPMEVDAVEAVDAVALDKTEANVVKVVDAVTSEKTEVDDVKMVSSSPRKTLEEGDSDTDIEDASPQETKDRDLKSAAVSNEEIQKDLPGEPSAVDTLEPPVETTEKPQESSEDKAEEVSETVDKAEEISEIGDKAEEISEIADKAEEVSETVDKAEEISEIADEAEEISEIADEAEEVSETVEKAEEVSETVDSVKESEKDSSESNHEEHPVTPDGNCASSSPNQVERPNIVDEIPKEDEQSTSEQHPEDEIEPQQDGDKDGNTQTTEDKSDDDVAVNLDAALTDLCDASAPVRDSALEDVSHDSPVKQKDLEAVMASDVGQSPSTGRTRGTWSPSASPSTSILKKCQKRPLEEDTPSPCVKSRRVSFANPIQQQETADDIDRRSPAVRTSSPRRPKMSNIPQPKYVTTPTKGLLILSPRNLRSPGYKSSKKCLISEMSQEPRPVPRDCIYPPLVGCSTPVEAVLPQISSNMWSRGFGQLVRARNIKTVGDLSALTPSEIKTLPIRSPKISNVKKALKSYEQQRKGRGGDDLKSFDEMEMMTSELEETSAPQNQDEEDKTSGETLATELVDEPAAADEKSQQDVSGNWTQEAAAVEVGERAAGGAAPPPAGLLAEAEALTCRMTPTELSGCSSQQLVRLHHQLGGAMQRVVAELHTRLQQTEDKP